MVVTSAPARTLIVALPPLPPLPAVPPNATIPPVPPTLPPEPPIDWAWMPTASTPSVRTMPLCSTVTLPPSPPTLPAPGLPTMP